MLTKFIQYFLHYTFLFCQFQAQVLPPYLDYISNSSVLHIFIDLVKVDHSLVEQDLLDNLLDDHTRPKLIFNVPNLILGQIKYYQNCYHYAYTDPKLTRRFDQKMIYFIIPAISKWLDARNLYQVQLSLSSCGDNPDSVFLVDTDVTGKSPISLTSYPLVKWTAKLFVINPAQLETFVICHSCGSYPPVM